MNSELEIPIQTSGCCGGGRAATSSTPATETVTEGNEKKIVREYYAERARTGTSCCGGLTETDFEKIGAAIGYSQEELSAVPEGANLGLGCGNPTAMAAIPVGATVVDLGSGAGFDCFLAARIVGPTGRVIGVDMTPEMIDRARANALRTELANVEFRLGEIEALPVADASVDVIISNCVINLSPNKPQVFAESFRVLKPGGQLMVSDIVLTQELPEFLRRSAAAYAGCVSGAELKDDYLAMIEAAGFTDVRVVGTIEKLASGGNLEWIPEDLREPAAQYIDVNGEPPVISLKVMARKPG